MSSFGSGHAWLFRCLYQGPVAFLVCLSCLLIWRCVAACRQALEVVRALQKAIEKRHGPGGAAAVAAAAAASTAAGGSQPGRPGSTAVGPARGTSQAGGPEGAPPSTRSKPGLTRGGPGGMSMKHSAGGHSAGGGPPSLISSNHKDEKVRFVGGDIEVGFEAWSWAWCSSI